VRPIRRSEFLAAKLLNAMTYALLLAVTGTMASWALVAFRGEASGIDFGGELMFSGQEMNVSLLVAALLNLACLLTAAAFAVMMSVLARRSATAISGAIGLWLVVEYTKHAFHFGEFIFSSYLDFGWMVFGDRCSGLATPFAPGAYYALAVCAVWFALFTGIAFVAMRRRNFGP
jgi:hypothetical protein